MNRTEKSAGDELCLCLPSCSRVFYFTDNEQPVEGSTCGMNQQQPGPDLFSSCHPQTAYFTAARPTRPTCTLCVSAHFLSTPGFIDKAWIFFLPIIRGPGSFDFRADILLLIISNSETFLTHPDLHLQTVQRNPLDLEILLVTVLAR